MPENEFGLPPRYGGQQPDDDQQTFEHEGKGRAGQAINKITEGTECKETAEKSVEVAQGVIGHTSSKAASVPHVSLQEPSQTTDLIVENVGTIAVTPHKPSAAKNFATKEFTEVEMKSLEKLAGCIPGVFDEERWDKPDSVVNKVCLAFADIQANHGFTFPDSHEILQRIGQVPSDLRSDVQTAVLLLQAKDIGHEWSLNGQVRIEDHQFDFSGTQWGHMNANIAKKLNDYLNANPVQNLPKNSPLALLSKNDRTRLERAFNEAADLINQSVPENREAKAEKALKNFRENKLLVVPTGWSDEKTAHAIIVVLYEDTQGNQYLVYINRGEQLENNNPDMKIFQITKEVTKESIKELLLADEETAAGKLKRMEFFEGGKAGGMHELFGLKQIMDIEKKFQKAGNCSFANAKGGFHAAVVMMLMDGRLAKSAHPERATTLNEMKAAIEAVKDPGREIYKGWTSDMRMKQLSAFLVLYNKIGSRNFDINKSDYLNAVIQIYSKLIDKTFFRSYESDARTMQQQIENFIRNSDFLVADCVIPEDKRLVERGDDEATTKQCKTVLKEFPEAFIIFKTSNGQLRLVYTNAEGNALHETIPPNLSLQELRKSKNLKYPIALTKELFDSATQKASKSQILADEKAAKDSDLLYDTKESAEAAIATKPLGSFVFYPAEKLGKYKCLIMMPNREVSITAHSINEDSRYRLSDEKTLLSDQKRYYAYVPSYHVFEGSDPDTELRDFMTKITASFDEAKDGAYAVVHTKEIPEGIDIRNDAYNFIETTKLLVKQGAEIVELPLDPNQKLLEQIDRKLTELKGS